MTNEKVWPIGWCLWEAIKWDGYGFFSPMIWLLDPDLTMF